eukprot:TRINITY_DN549_c0_g1_i1.p1 TRINITY_DN549_c0_g1~~TRINITY_DN549_c0_g1_i1.p1  ORF type:complete len:265 (-),score=11.52 TRINITY_DN549_c0_g1_i1:86-880(-)
MIPKYVSGQQCSTFFFFFKQKTAYEIMPSLVGSEMCIRDRYYISTLKPRKQPQVRLLQGSKTIIFIVVMDDKKCRYIIIEFHIEGLGPTALAYEFLDAELGYPEQWIPLFTGLIIAGYDFIAFMNAAHKLFLCTPIVLGADTMKEVEINENDSIIKMREYLPFWEIKCVTKSYLTKTSITDKFIPLFRMVDNRRRSIHLTASGWYANRSTYAILVDNIRGCGKGFEKLTYLEQKTCALASVGRNQTNNVFTEPKASDCVRRHWV